MPHAEFTNMTAFVTGAAGGIGRAVHDELRDRGATVAAIDSSPTIEDFVAGYRLDVRDHSAVEEVVARVERDHGPIDILVNVAGILRPGSLLETSDQDWQDTLAVNTTGVFNVTKAVAKRMATRQRGSIVTVASNAGGVPRTGIGAYAASKAASAHLTKCFGLELAQHSIRCNVVSPGSTDTNMLRSLWGDGDKALNDAVAGNPQSFRMGIPLGAVGQPSNVADAVCFLSSDAASQLTMQEIFVDGGASLR